jgi:hypothetical protein
MSRTILSFGRFFLSAFVVSLLCLPVVAQVQLREALDYDHDNKVDLSIFRPSDKFWYILHSSGDGVTFQQWGLEDDRLVPGDYDGDDTADIAIWRESEGNWYVLNSSNHTYTLTNWGIDGDEPVARDYDGDGKTDLAIVRSSGGNRFWWILRSTGGIDNQQWGLDTDFVTPGDYDGDGKFDIAVTRPGATLTSQAYFYVLGSKDGYFGAPWGISSDYVVPGDYDGDGKTDFAVVREGASPTSPLVWWILRSDGLGIMSKEFGVTADDYLTQGDYDGDGKTEIAVWRKTDGMFYIHNLTTQVTWQAQWGTTGDLPVAAYDNH